MTRIKTIIEKASRGYLVMLHDGTVLRADNQRHALSLVKEHDRAIGGTVVNEVEWRGVKKLVAT